MIWRILCYILVPFTMPFERWRSPSRWRDTAEMLWSHISAP